MCRLTRYYEARCGWVWLDDGGRWLPVRLLVGYLRDPGEAVGIRRPVEAAARPQEIQMSGRAEIAVAGRPNGIAAAAG